MSILDELHKKLEDAIFDVSRAKAAVDTNEQRFRMGVDIPSSALFRDNLRLEYTLSVVKKIEKAIASVKHKKQLTKANAKKPALSEDNFIELERLKLEGRKIIDESARLERLAKAERHRASLESRYKKQELLIAKMRHIVGEDTFRDICEEVNEGQDNCEG